MRKHIQQHFRIGIGVHVTQVLQKHILLELRGIGQIAIVGKHQTERRIHIKRLRFGRIIGRARSRIAAMSNAPVANQAAHIARAKHIAHQTGTFVHMKTATRSCGYPGCILSAVLKHLQTIV